MYYYYFCTSKVHTNYTHSLALLWFLTQWNLLWKARRLAFWSIVRTLPYHNAFLKICWNSVLATEDIYSTQNVVTDALYFAWINSLWRAILKGSSPMSYFPSIILWCSKTPHHEWKVVRNTWSTQQLEPHLFEQIIKNKRVKEVVKINLT